MGKEERLIHRDDVPMDVAESIVADLQAMYPGYTVQFAGDSGNPKAAEAAKQLGDELAKLLVEGRCMDCGRQMEGWPGAEMADDWRPNEGWCHFSDYNDELMGWQCPECDVDDKLDEAPRLNDNSRQ